ncbi:MAG TPA: hypothetical protein VH835_02050, partial [Dongiaceae bacterium]
MSDVRRTFVLGTMAAALLMSAAPAGAANPGEPGPGALGEFLAGMHAQQVRDYDAAADYLADVLANDPDNVDLLQQGFIAMASGGRLEEAAAIGRKLEGQDAGSDTVSLILAMQDLKAQKIDAALARLATLSTTGLNQFTVPLVRGWVTLEKGDTEGAVALLAPLAEVRGVQSLYNLHVGLLNEVGGRAADAETAYGKATEDPEKL